MWSHEVQTRWSLDGDIEQFTITRQDGVVKSHIGKVVKTQNEQFIKAMIELGWTPPTGNRKEKP